MLNGYRASDAGDIIRERAAEACKYHLGNAAHVGDAKAFPGELIFATAADIT